MAAIKATLALEAKVSTSAVKLTLAEGSVVVSSEIFVASQEEMDAKATVLSTSILKDSASLETALKTQFTKAGLPTASLKVETVAEITKVGGGGGGGAGIIAAIGGAVATVLLIGTVAFIIIRRKRKAKGRAPVSTTLGVPTASQAQTAVVVEGAMPAKSQCIAWGAKFDVLTGRPIPKFDPQTGKQNWGP